jgi:hypothetical protein
MFNAMYQQAMLLSDGHVDRLTLRELSPRWTSKQMTGSKVNVDCNILLHDNPSCWIACINKIHENYSTDTEVAPNYLQGLGGTTAIQRLIDSDMGESCVYNPKAFDGKTPAAIRKFPLFDMHLDLKSVLHGVSIHILICHIMDITIDCKPSKIAFLIAGWRPWNTILYTNRPGKDAEFPRPLDRSGEGVLIAFLTGADCHVPYEYYRLYDKCKEQLQLVRVFQFQFCFGYVR